MTCGCRPLIYCFHLSHPQVSLQKAALMTALHPDPPAAGGRAQGWSRAPRHVSEQHQHLLRSGGSEPQQITVRNSPPKKVQKNRSHPRFAGTWRDQSTKRVRKAANTLHATRSRGLYLEVFANQDSREHAGRQQRGALCISAGVKAPPAGCSSCRQQPLTLSFGALQWLYSRYCLSQILQLMLSPSPSRTEAKGPLRGTAAGVRRGTKASPLPLVGKGAANLKLSPDREQKLQDST